jgi:nucleoside-diphosphate-sugar epimerase
MRALVTGEIGFIGTNLTNRFAMDTKSLCSTILVVRGLRHNLDWLKVRHRGRAQLIQGDVRDTGAVDMLMKGADVVFHPPISSTRF